MPKKLPISFKKYFWDVDADNINLTKNSPFVIQRILNKGDAESIRWLKDNYSNRDFVDSLMVYRDFSPKVANFWALMLDVPKEKIVCLQTPYLKMRKSHWPY